MVHPRIAGLLARVPFLLGPNKFVCVSFCPLFDMSSVGVWRLRKNEKTERQQLEDVAATHGGYYAAIQASRRKPPR
jgi:hypothetical protein